MRVPKPCLHARKLAKNVRRKYAKGLESGRLLVNTGIVLIFIRRVIVRNLQKNARKSIRRGDAPWLLPFIRELSIRSRAVTKTLYDALPVFSIRWWLALPIAATRSRFLACKNAWTLPMKYWGTIPM